MIARVAFVLIFCACNRSAREPPGKIDMGFVTGELAVYQGQGLVRVEGTRTIEGRTLLEVEAVEHRTRILVPPSSTALRRPVDRGEAERLLSILRRRSGDSDQRSAAERHHEYWVTLIRRPLEAQVVALHRLYRTDYELSFGERKLIDTFERVVVGELAHALGREIDPLLAQLRAGQPAFAPTRRPRPVEPKPVEPVPPVKLKGHQYLGRISAPSGRILVGEFPRQGFLAEVRAGEWHAYVTEEALALIHGDALAKYAKLQLVELAQLEVEGGTMAMIAMEGRYDEKLEEAMLFPVAPIIEGRAVTVSTNGDGAHRLRGARDGDRVVALVVDF